MNTKRKQYSPTVEKCVDKDRLYHLSFEYGLTKTQGLIYHLTIDKKMRICECADLLGVTNQAVYDAKRKATAIVSSYSGRREHPAY